MRNGHGAGTGRGAGCPENIGVRTIRDYEDIIGADFAADGSGGEDLDICIGYAHVARQIRVKRRSTLNHDDIRTGKHIASSKEIGWQVWFPCAQSSARADITVTAHTSRQELICI